MLTSTALLLDSNIRNSVCTPAKLPCRRVEVVKYSDFVKIRLSCNLCLKDYRQFTNYNNNNIEAYNV
jgi:hypothetical protein